MKEFKIEVFVNGRLAVVGMSAKVITDFEGTNIFIPHMIKELEELQLAKKIMEASE